MKPTHLLSLLCILPALLVSAQLAPAPGEAPLPQPINQIDFQALLATRLPDGSFPVTIAKRAQDHRRWERITLETNRFGVKIRTNSWVELESGMHHRSPETGQWIESAPEIIVTNSGPFGALARGAPHQARFAANINSPVSVQVLTPDNRNLKLRILGMALEDFKARTNVLIAEIKDADGYLVGSNQVIYPDAFTDFHADVRYTYTKSGIEQDVILRQRPPLPEEFGLNPVSTRLLLLTEFIDPPTNVVRIQQIRRGWKKSKVDKALTFGAMTIGQGTAFGLGEESNRHNGIPVQKRWQILDGRQFLVEELSFHRLVPLLQNLQASLEPPTAGKTRLAGTSLPPPTQAKAAAASTVNSQVSTIGSPVRGIPSHKLLLPPVKTASAPAKGSFRLAAASPEPNGLVLDFNLQNATNMVLQADTTYVVASNATVNLTSNSVIEGGCIVKFGRYSQINFLGPVTCLTGPYRPAIFTAVDDNSVGETVSGSTGNPTNYYANCALSLGVGGDLKYLHIRYAKEAIYCSESDYAVSHSQFLSCQVGLHSDNASFYNGNILMYQVTTNYYGSFFSGYAEHLTSDQASILIFDPDFNYDDWCHGLPSASMTIVNTLTASITNGYGLHDTPAIPTIVKDHVRDFPTGSGVFQTVGAASHYLCDGSTNRDCGIYGSPSMHASLMYKTTYPPVVLSNLVISADTLLSPQAQRDTDTLDLGYHYDPLDFIFGLVPINGATVQLLPGTAIATFGSYGISLAPGSKFTSIGTAVSPNHIVRYDTVQENLNTNWNAGGLSIIGDWRYSISSAQATFKFTEWSILAQDGTHLDNSWQAMNGYIADCQFHGGRFSLANPSLCVSNCLFDRVQSDISDDNASAEMDLVVRNCLFFGGAANLTHDGYSDTWLFRDNLFDKTSIYQDGDIDGAYNAYVTNFSRLTPTNIHDLVITNTDYQAGPLGSYYYPTNGGKLNRLINVGSTTADLVGLYHYTVITNLVAGRQVKETNSIVDIGYHYVAVDSAGKPIDTDADGLADYFEDSNGDGTYNTGDLADWNSADTDGDGVSDYIEYIQGRNPRISGTVPDTTWAAKLQVYTPLK